MNEIQAVATRVLTSAQVFVVLVSCSRVCYFSGLSFHLFTFSLSMVINAGEIVCATSLLSEVLGFYCLVCLFFFFAIY